MSITISDGVASVLLDDEMRWEDEFEWHRVGQSQTRSVSGALLLQIGTRSGAGRPITLAAGDGEYGTTFAGLQQLATWADIAGQELSLSIPSRSQYFARVTFAHDSEAALRADPLIDYNERLADDMVRIDRLALITLE